MVSTVTVEHLELIIIILFLLRITGGDVKINNRQST